MAQFIVAFLASALCLFVSWVAAYSVLLGGLACALPSAFMAWHMTRKVVNPAMAITHVVRGEIGKFALTVAMFSGVFFWVQPLEIGSFFTTLIVCMCLNIVVPVLKTSASREERETGRTGAYAAKVITKQ